MRDQNIKKASNRLTLQRWEFEAHWSAVGPQKTNRANAVGFQHSQLKECSFSNA